MNTVKQYLTILRNTLLLIVLPITGGCMGTPKEDRLISHPSSNYRYANIDPKELSYSEYNYVPVYSDIYHQDGTRRFNLTVTLSIRSITFTDTVYIQKADYYDSHGKIIKKYIDSTLALFPMESIEFVVDENETSGGAGANFVVKWSAKRNNNQVLIQSVMIGTSGQQGVSFISESKLIKQEPN